MYGRWESTAIRVVWKPSLGLSRAMETTWGPTRSALPAKPRSRRRFSRFATTASASSGAPSWKRTPSRSVKVQLRPSTVAQVVASAGSGRVPSGRKRTRVSHTFTTIPAETRSVALWGSMEMGSARIPTTTVSAGEARRARARRTVTLPFQGGRSAPCTRESFNKARQRVNRALVRAQPRIPNALPAGHRPRHWGGLTSVSGTSQWASRISKRRCSSILKVSWSGKSLRAMASSSLGAPRAAQLA